MTTDQVRALLAPIIQERTQLAVAKTSKVPQSHVSAWLAGRPVLSEAKIVRLAAACGVKLEQGWRVVGTPPAKPGTGKRPRR